MSDSQVTGISVRQQPREKKITKIVITGGPCAGKTTGMAWIAEAFEKKGYLVLFVPESATELINANITPKTCGSVEVFQNALMHLQKEKEMIFEETAQKMNADKILIVCDRGMMDSRAYMDEQPFLDILAQLDMDRMRARDEYDAVFHLVTAAKGARQFYTCENNSARFETAEEAVLVDDALIAAWTGHPHLRIIGNESGFEQKMEKLMAEISNVLQESAPLETKRKFLISHPDSDLLKSMPHARKIEIKQTFLESDGDEEKYLCQRGENGSCICTLTIKQPHGKAEWIETEKRISLREYQDLLRFTDPKRAPLIKERYCMSENGHYFEADLYPFSKDQAILEAEQNSLDENFEIPSCFNALKEVTEDPRFSDSRLALRNPCKELQETGKQTAA